MGKVRAIAALLLSSHLVVTTAALAQKKCETPTAVTDPKFFPGQIWTYKTRAGEAGSTITILRVEQTSKLGVIVHVRIDGFQWRNCSGGPSPESIQHVPFERAALDASVLRNTGTAAQLPEYGEGYDNWLSHCGGAYSLTADKVLDADELTFNSGQTCR